MCIDNRVRVWVELRFTKGLQNLVLGIIKQREQFGVLAYHLMLYAHLAINLAWRFVIEGIPTLSDMFLTNPAHTTANTEFNIVM